MVRSLASSEEKTKYNSVVLTDADGRRTETTPGSFVSEQFAVLGFNENQWMESVEKHYYIRIDWQITGVDFS